jgi:hypothetical protein
MLKNTRPGFINTGLFSPVYVCVVAGGTVFKQFVSCDEKAVENGWWIRVSFCTGLKPR